MTAPAKPKPFNQIKQEDIEKLFLLSPGQDLIPKLLGQMAKIPGFIKIFGPYKPQANKGNNQQRWADYHKFDWSLRQLPAINVYEADTESKQSDNAFLTGTVAFQIFWPGSFRRSDMRRVEVAFKGALENFFSSRYVQSMLDELYWIERPEKVFGLNELGRTLTWTPNIDGMVEDQLVPVTIFNVNYKIDLRSWYRALEFLNRTREEPFKETLGDLVEIGDPDLDSVYQGVDNENEVHIEIPDDIKVNS